MKVPFTLTELMKTRIDMIIGQHASQRIYHESLDIKLEEDPRGITCLGSLIYEKDKQLHIRYLNKNEQALLGCSQPNGRILRFQHKSSFSPNYQKVGIIIGELCRIQRLTSDHHNIVEQSMLLTKELKQLKYTTNEITTAVLRKYKSTNDPIWKSLHHTLTTGTHKHLL